MSLPALDASFPLWSIYVTIFIIFGSMKSLKISHWVSSFVYWKRSLVWYTVSPNRFNYCCSKIFLPWKSSGCYYFLKANIARSDWTRTLFPPSKGAILWRSLYIIVHTETSQEQVGKTLYDCCAVDYLIQVPLVKVTKSECPR